MKINMYGVLVLEYCSTLRSHNVLVFNPPPGPSLKEEQEVGVGVYTKTFLAKADLDSDLEPRPNVNLWHQDPEFRKIYDIKMGELFSVS